MALRVYNTLTRKKERFTPWEEGRVLFYVCGPTVYDSAHIGHGMSYVAFDAIRRYLEYRGYHVQHVQNFTDVEDKIIRRAAEQGVPWRELTAKYIHEFLSEMDELNVQRAHLYPFASQEIDQIVRLIQGLIEKGNAYTLDGDVYFRVKSDARYGQLSHRDLEDMQAGARVEIDERKEHPMDFALWKSAKPGEPSWDSPWGAGRPGWHIECSAMSLRYLGNQIDIHGGGRDLIFPHHENEIAQSECFTTEHPFVKYWLHNGLLQLGGEKMSKSIGNLITLREVLDTYGADAFRFFVLSSHYRRPLTFTEDSLEAATKGAERLRSAMRPARLDYDPDVDATALLQQMGTTQSQFEEAMDDDFNTAQALAALFDLVRVINQARDDRLGGEAFLQAQGTVLALSRVLGFRLAPRPAQSALGAAPFIDALVKLRRELRDNKQWALADQVRDELAGQGVTLEDSPEGTSWHTK